MQSILSLVSSKLRELKVTLANLSIRNLVDVDSAYPQNLGILQWDGFTQKYISAPPETIDAVVDAGGADAVYIEVLTIDGGGA